MLAKSAKFALDCDSCHTEQRSLHVHKDSKNLKIHINSLLIITLVYNASPSTD